MISCKSNVNSAEVEEGVLLEDMTVDPEPTGTIRCRSVTGIEATGSVIWVEVTVTVAERSASDVDGSTAVTGDMSLGASRFFLVTQGVCDVVVGCEEIRCSKNTKVFAVTTLGIDTSS